MSKPIDTKELATKITLFLAGSVVDIYKRQAEEPSDVEKSYEDGLDQGWIEAVEATLLFLTNLIDKENGKAP